MEVGKIVVIVEDEQVSKTALQWALNNLLRHGDLITLLHVFSSPSSKSSKNRTKKLHLLRLNGFQLALSFQHLCSLNFPHAKIEIVVTEGDADGEKIATTVRNMGASKLVVGLHDRSFLYRIALSQSDIRIIFNCRVFAIKQPQASISFGSNKHGNNAMSSLFDTSTSMDFSQIEIAHLQKPEEPPAKIRYTICPNPSAIIWRSSKKSRRKNKKNSSR